MPRVLSLAAALFIAFLPALTGWAAGPRAWYESLRKPAWNPPAWVFGPVWTALYASMGVASWLVWRRRAENPPAVRRALTAYAVQLALNAAWTPLFFGLKRPGLALLDIALLWLAIAATGALFQRVHRPAAALLLPYLAWVTFAAALNFELWRLNP